MANLFEINADMVNALEQSIDPETGEILSDEMLAKFESLQMEFDEKVEKVALYIKNLEADAVALKNEKDSFAKREKVTKNKIASLKEYLNKGLCGEKFESTKCTISYRKSEKVEISDIELIPEKFISYEPTADKTAIKKALKSGEVIAGAMLVESQNVQIK